MMGLRNPELKSLIKFLSSKYGLTQEHIEEILEAPFELTAKVMKNEFSFDKKSFPSIRIPFFGRFYSPPYARLTYLDRLKIYVNDDGTPRISDESSPDIQELSTGDS